MASILRSPQALQLTLALIKPDAVAHPLILEVRMNPKPLPHALGIATASGAIRPLMVTDNTDLCWMLWRQS